MPSLLGTARFGILEAGTMAAAIMSELDRMSESDELSDGAYLKLANMLKAAKALHSDALHSDAQKCCPVMFAEVGDVFEHHYYQPYEDGNDSFEYLGRSTECAKEGWLIFRHLHEYDGRGICAHGCKRGLNGGVRDAIRAWPLVDYRHLRADGTTDENEIVLPPEKCWGFRFVEQMEEDEEEESVGSPEEVATPGGVD